MIDIYRQIEEELEKRRNINARKELRRREEVYKNVPGFLELEIELKTNAAKMAMEVLRENKSYDDSFLKSSAQKKSMLLKKHGYPTDYLDPIYDCKICLDKGYKDGKICSCIKHKRISALHENSNIKRILERENFNTFDLNVFKDEEIEGEELSQRKNMELNLKLSKKFIEDFSKDNGLNLLFYGNTGLGKTFLLNCIAKQMLDLSYVVIYHSAYELVDIFEEHRFKKTEIGADRFNNLKEADLLIIDDLGAEFSNSFTSSEIFNIINKRLIDGKKIVISSNLNPKELSLKYSDRLISRLFSNFYMARFYGEDIRW